MTFDPWMLRSAIVLALLFAVTALFVFVVEREAHRDD